MQIERRNHPRRLIAADSVFVVDHCSEKVGTLIDLSVGGMQLSYLPEKFTCNQWTLIDIMADEQNQCLITGLACEIVYDVASLMENGRFSGMDVRVCGVCFNRLTVVQKNSLDQLLARVASA